MTAHFPILVYGLGSDNIYMYVICNRFEMKHRPKNEKNRKQTNQFT